MSGPQRKRSRNWVLRLFFAGLILAYTALSVFTNTNVVLPDDGPTSLEKSLTYRNKTVANDTTHKEYYTPNMNDDQAIIHKTALEGSTIQLQAAISTRRQRRNRRNRPNHRNHNKKKRVRGYQEARLQKLLNWTLDLSEYDPKALHESLIDYYDVPSDNTSRLWDNPQSRIPGWMKRYLRWHSYKRSQLVNEAAAKQLEPVKLLVMQCLASDDHCGGVSDRLKPLPYLIRNAYYTKRLLLIYWSRPSHLEAFLVPPRGGLDWTVPQWMVPTIESQSTGVFTFSEDTLRSWSRTDISLVRSRFQDYHGGMHNYNAQLVEGEVSFAELFHDLWRIAFTPSPPVRALLESDMRRLGLVPGQYVGAHLRALYAITSRPDSVTQNWANNAMNCASELRPGKAIFFVSDSDKATEYAIQYAVQRNATIITRTPNPNPPVHMDKVSNWRTRNISDFFDSFVDIYIMGHADCLTYNKGGYGLLGLFMSRNYSCGLRQDAIDRPHIRNPCTWMDEKVNNTETTRHITPLKWNISNAIIYEDPMNSAYLHSS